MPQRQRKLKKSDPNKVESLTKPKFNEKQLAFMRSYVVCKNASQAARDAGYSKKTAKQQGSRLLTNVDVRAMVDRTLAEAAKRRAVTPEEVIEHVKYTGMVNAFDYVSYDSDGKPYFNLAEIEKKDRMLGVAISGIDFEERIVGGNVVTRKTKLRLRDNQRAFEMLNDATGAFRKHNKGIDDETAKVNIYVNTNIPGAPGSNIKRAEPVVMAEIEHDASD